MKEVFSGAQGESQPKVIDNDRQFRFSFADAKDQFSVIRIDLAMGHSLEELQERNSKLPYDTFEDYILKNKNLILADKIKNDEVYKQPILIHNNLIKRVKTFQSIKELQQIIKEVDEFIKSDF